MGVITGDWERKIPTLNIWVPSIVLPNRHWFVRLVMRMPTFMFHVEAARMGVDIKSHSQVFLWRRKGLAVRIQLIRWMISAGKSPLRAVIDGLFN